MVLDPGCRTYVVKDRAVTRRIRGSVHSFCSEACARRYEDGPPRLNLEPQSTHVSSHG